MVSLVPSSYAQNDHEEAFEQAAEQAGGWDTNDFHTIVFELLVVSILFAFRLKMKLSSVP